MRISPEQEQLAHMKFGQRADEISRKYAEISRRTEWMPRGGAKRQAEDNALIGRRTELVEAWIEIYLEAFTKERLVPDNQDLKEMENRIDQMAGGSVGNDFHKPLVSSVDAIRMIPTRAKFKLRTKVKEMELENRGPAVRSGVIHNTINIHGDNRGNIQQGGEGNTQHIINPDKLEVKPDEEH